MAMMSARAPESGVRGPGSEVTLLLSLAMNRRRKLVAWLLAPVLLLAGAAYAMHDYARGASFVIQAANMQGAARTAAEWGTDAVTESPATVPWRGGELPARWYRVAAPRRAVLMVPGVHAGGIDEPRLVQFARDISSMGFSVITVQLTDLARYSITPRTTDMIEDAALWLAASPDAKVARSATATNDGRIGMMGISFAGGLSIVAASRPALRDRVAFVMSFGGHGDLPRTLRYLSTGVQPGGEQRPPHDYGVAIILLGVLGVDGEHVVPEGQKTPLRQAILAFLDASHLDMVDKPRAKLAFDHARALAKNLDEPARTLMGYINDRSVDKLGPILVPHLKLLSGDEALSPARESRPAAAVFLLHGTDDNVIPAIESRLLADTLRGRGVEVHQLTTPLITHAEVDRSAALRAFWDLTQFWGALLSH
jgi:dienelactone hydrolase